MATSVFCTRSSSAFSTSRRACSCLAGPAFLSLESILMTCYSRKDREKIRLRLLRRVQLQPTNPDRLPSLHSHCNASIERCLPGVQKVLLDSRILVQSGSSHLLPPARVEPEGLAQFVRLGGATMGGRRNGKGCGVGSAGKSVR